MKKTIYVFFLLLAGLCISCSENEDLTQEEEAQNLEALLSEIQDMASSVTCNDASEWTFTSYGSKACGGPVGYIAYSSNINTSVFLQKIERHREAQEAFNIKWGIVSDCSLPPQPTAVTCEDGNPVLEY